MFGVYSGEEPMTLSRNEQVLSYFIQACSGRLGRTQLVKLLYLADYEAYRYLGRPITEFAWKTDNYGPFDRAFPDVLGSLQASGQVQETEYLTPFGNIGYRYQSAGPVAYAFSPAEERILRHVIESYSKLPRGQLVEDVVYDTEPFKAVKDEPSGSDIRWDVVANERRDALGGIDLEAVERGKRHLLASKGQPFTDLLQALRRGNAVDAVQG